MNLEIISLLVRLGCDPSLRGFLVLHDAIRIYMDAFANGEIPRNVYQTLAERRGKSCIVIEHNIRSVIESVCNNDIDGHITDILGTPPDYNSGKYKNLQFISLCAFKLLREAK